MAFLIKSAILGFIIYLIDMFTYKLIRRIDKKERKKIDKYELDQVELINNKMKELKNGSDN